MSRKFLFIGVVLIICISAGAYTLANSSDPVYYRIIQEPADALDASRIEWMKQKDMQKGVHLYSLETGNPYELLVYDNSRLEENVYRTTTFNSKLQDKTLRIDINDRDAADDSFVNETVIAYFIIKDKPVAIEVYRNGVKEDYKMESGDENISK
jgi:hypothetical protein